MHSFDTEPKGAASLRQGIVSTATPRREHDRPSQGLAPRRHPLRPMRPHLLLGHLHRSYRHFLAAVVSPEPSLASSSFPLFRCVCPVGAVRETTGSRSAGYLEC